MCGIAGIIHRGKSSNVGGEMTSMLMALRHRGPDSTGFAVYGPSDPGSYVMRVKVAEREDMNTGHDIMDRIADRVKELERRLELHGSLADEAWNSSRSTPVAANSPLRRGVSYASCWKPLGIPQSPYRQARLIS